jgi:hypothetical protein
MWLLILAIIVGMGLGVCVGILLTLWHTFKDMF